MRKIIAIVVAVLLGVPAGTLAQERVGSSIRAAEIRGVARLFENNRFLLQDTGTPAAPVKEPNWISRHPVWFGALAGFGGGFIIGGAACESGNSDDSLCGLAAWAGGGAGYAGGGLTGLLISRRPWVRRHPAVTGAMLGALGGYLGGALACAPYPRYNDRLPCSARGLTYGGIGAGIGAGVGLIHWP